MCLILLKPLLFTPNTSDGALHVLNLKIKYSKIKSNLNLSFIKYILGIFNIDKIRQIRQNIQICELSLNFRKPQL